jgi:hypothetical protein
MPKGKGNRFGPVGRCIYCLSEIAPLTDEHIIPDGMNGDIILNEASCEICQIEINKSIENPAMNNFFRNIRYRMGMGSRRKNKRPKTLPLRVPIAGSDASKIEGKINLDLWEPKEVPYDEHLTMVSLLWLQPPGLLRGLSRGESENTPPIGTWVYSMVGQKSQTPVLISSKIDPFVQLKLIAKIAHGFAVYRYGLDGFAPYLTDFIRGKEFSDPNFFIGNEFGPPQPPIKSPWHVKSSILTHGQIILVRVRLFANIGSPTYVAAVGQHLPDSARLKPYDRLDRE